MKTGTCPSCGASASGRFCSQCGASLEAAACRDCGSPLAPGARFCNQCGAAAPGTPAAATSTTSAVGPRERGSPLPWVVAAGALLALSLLVLLPRLGDAGAPEAPSADPVAAGGAAGQGTPPDISSMSPRERADRLFNRVMGSLESGDTAAALQFQPMGVAAYQMAAPLDADGRYHLATLQLVARAAAPARAQADSILAADSTHLFGLFTAAQAEQVLGNTAEAERFFRRFLEAYPAQVARDLPEYQDHAQTLPQMRRQAEEATGTAPAQ